MEKIIRTATIALSLDILLKGQLKFLNNHYETVALSGEDLHLQAVEEREKVRIVPIRMQRRIKPVNDFISLIKLYRAFKREKPLIVHSITPKAGLLSMTAAYFAGVPIRIHTFTGLVFPSKKGNLQKILILMDKIVCIFATDIYPEGEGVRSDLLQYNITKKPLKIIGNGNVNGIDTEYYHPEIVAEKGKSDLRKELQIVDSDFVFIFVGRLVKDKGINELVRAFSKLHKKHNHCKLLLVGSFENHLDPIDPKTLEEIRTHENIITTGYQNDVRSYFAISNALAFPSYREGFPNVVMQAGAMGMPSIVTDINGSNEIIIHKENGLVIAPKNESALFDAMELMLTGNDIRGKMQQNARPMIVARYEQQVVWNAILEEYKLLEHNSKIMIYYEEK